MRADNVIGENSDYPHSDSWVVIEFQLTELELSRKGQQGDLLVLFPKFLNLNLASFLSFLAPLLCKNQENQLNVNSK